MKREYKTKESTMPIVKDTLTVSVTMPKITRKELKEKCYALDESKALVIKKVSNFFHHK